MSGPPARVLEFHTRRDPEVTVTITAEGTDKAPCTVVRVAAPFARMNWGLSRPTPVGADLNTFELQLVVDALGLALADLTRGVRDRVADLVREGKL